MFKASSQSFSFSLPLDVGISFKPDLWDFFDLEKIKLSAPQNFVISLFD